MEILRRFAHSALRPYVRSFGQRRMSLRGLTTTTPLPARPDQFIEFYLGERYRVSVDDGVAELAPESAVVGPQTRPGVRLHMTGTIDVFTIRFQPTGFHRMFGAPMPELTDRGVAIGDVLGAGAAGLETVVRRAGSFDARVAEAERWLLDRIERAAAPDAFDLACRLMAAAGGRSRIDAIAARSGLSDRQFRRRFTSDVGVTPKFYARVLRLETALDMRRNSPGQSWTRIVHEAGYADQAHFIRDCRELSGATPTLFVESDGLAEIFNLEPG